MVTARINTPGVIGKVAVRPNQRTTIADPKFTPKPNVGLVELFRFTLIRGYHILSFYDFFISGMISIVIFVLGLFIFKYKENTFVDYL